MKVILTKDVANVGRAGQVKEVADGYARNYLIPRGLASAATEQAMKGHQAQEAVEKHRQVRAEEAERRLADEVSKTELVFKVKVGEQHRLYGSITNTDIAEALSKKLQHPFDKHHVDLEEPFKRLGNFKVTVRVGHKLRPQVAVVLQKAE